MRDRYGTDRPVRRRLTILLSGLVGLVALAWLGWAVWFQSTPDVESSLTGYQTRAHTATAHLQVHLRSGSVKASCLLRAYAADHTVVGELDFAPPSQAKSQSFSKTMRTEREATSLELIGCTSPNQAHPR
jgi:hypothetical protein